MPPKGFQSLCAVACVLLAPAVTRAQRRPSLSPDELQRLESTLERNPGDTAARTKLLDDYYFNKALKPADAIAARRRHILWLIENAPAGELAGTSPATIDPSGYYLADAEGYKLASEAWRAQAAKANVKTAVLLNAAFFFKTNDQAYTVSLLERALKIDPMSREIGARLGDEYALIILGVRLINQNGYPLRADPGLTQSALANTARDALTTSRNPYVLAKAGYMLAWQGSVLYFSRQLPFDPIPLAQAAADRAVSAAPGERDVAAYQNEIRRFARMDREADRLKNASPEERARSEQLMNQAAEGEATSPSQTGRPPVKQATAADLKTITVGMSREELLKLGAPAGRVTMDDDGHLMETYTYAVDGEFAGTVRLTDGTVSSLMIP